MFTLIQLQFPVPVSEKCTSITRPVPSSKLRSRSCFITASAPESDPVPDLLIETHKLNISSTVMQLKTVETRQYRRFRLLLETLVHLQSFLYQQLSEGCIRTVKKRRLLQYSSSHEPGLILLSWSGSNGGTEVVTLNPFKIYYL